MLSWICTTVQKLALPNIALLGAMTARADALAQNLLEADLHRDALLCGLDDTAPDYQDARARIARRHHDAYAAIYRDHNTQVALLTT